MTTKRKTPHKWDCDLANQRSSLDLPRTLEEFVMRITDEYYYAQRDFSSSIEASLFDPRWKYPKGFSRAGSMYEFKDIQDDEECNHFFRIVIGEGLSAASSRHKLVEFMAASPEKRRQIWIEMELIDHE